MRFIRLASLVVGSLFAALLVAPAQAAAAVGFGAPTDFDAGGWPASVAVGDFNADGNPDLAVANQLSNTVSVLLGTSGGSFSEPSAFDVGGFPVSVAVGNFNGDQDPDLAVANGSGTVSVLLGGTGASFTRQPDLDIGGAPWSVAVGDFNDDGDPDLAVADQMTGKILVLRGTDGGGFTAPTTVGTATGPSSIAVGEFNGDGDPDLAVADPYSGRVLVLLGRADADFTAPAPVASGLEDPVSVAVGEFDGDGDPDLAVAVQSPGKILVLLGIGDGSFTRHTPDLSVDGGVSSVAVGDFNRDGDPDLAVADFEDGRVSVLVGGAGGSFSGPINFDAGSGSPSVAVSDFNRDGKPDFAVASYNSGTVTVRLNTTVTNQAPVAADDAYTAAEDTLLTVAAPGVLGNDTDPDGDPRTAVLVIGPTHGDLTLNANGSFSYTPSANYTGSDSFTYRASDGTLTSNVATVTITVTGANDAPAAADDAYSTAEDTTLTVDAPGVLANDTDPDDPDGNLLSAVVEKEPNHGTVTLNPNGSFTYTPAAGYDGTDSFTYRADDGTVKSNEATVTITVTASPNQAPTAAADAYTTAEDTTLTVNAPGVLGDDSDPDDDPLSAVLVSGPSNGTLTLNGNGSFRYTPASNFTGSDSFSYRANDGTLTSNPATVTISVTAVNDSPTVTVAAGGACGKDDHSGTVNLTVADLESSAAGLTLSATSSNSELVSTGKVNFAGTGAARMMTVSAVDGRSGTATLTVIVTDGHDSGSVPVTVQVGGGGKDTLTGGTGADLLFAQSNNDTLNGKDGNDLLCGDSGSDTLSGGGDDDSLGGGSGSDRLTGGPGADSFSGGSGTDTATDFTAGEGDTIQGTIP